ncbi:MAG: hypothetical protein K9J27_12535 [Bacteroidales bacterium]|nr:hypothetical protein [Bacteroidales bacterium]MCF8334793.1 hypothetical protein [Bacteroidales bacterium]
MKKGNFRLLAMFFATFALGLTMTACDEDDDEKVGPDPDTGDNVIVNENITENTTWSNDNIYQLTGRIAVEDGATLTIQPGTIIKGELGSGANATALLIARGGKLMAEGTPDAPIIFTSVGDEIALADVAEGNFGSPNLEPDANGLWGGVLILGKAPISASNDDGDVNEIQIEGIPTSDQNGLYGGNQPDDNSGVIKYVSIRHGGANIGAGNEINGLSLGGVGTGTTVENIEIVANQDDGVEWFGGTVNVKNVLTWNVGDDGLDSDQSWAGSVDNFITIAPTGHAFELDGPEGSMEAGHTIKNGSVIASDIKLGRTTEDLVNVDDNSIVDLENIFFTGVVEGQQINNVTAAGVTFTNIMIDVPADSLSNHVNGEVPQGVTAGGSSQANTSAFSGWTWAAQAGAYSDL